MVIDYRFLLFLECDIKNNQMEVTMTDVYLRLVKEISLKNQWKTVMLITDEGIKTWFLIKAVMLGHFSVRRR